MTALPSMKCVCGHWDTEHSAFTGRPRPGKTRTFCDHCDCRSWMTPEDERAQTRQYDVAVCTPGCCEGCDECYGVGLGCHNRPAVRLLAEVRRLAEATPVSDDTEGAG